MAIIKCSECGKKISDKATKCPSCGAPVDKKTNESAIWGFSLSIVSIFLNIVAILSLAFSIDGLVTISHEHTEKGKGFAIAGLIISILMVLNLAISFYSTVYGI